MKINVLSDLKNVPMGVLQEYIREYSKDIYLKIATGYPGFMLIYKTTCSAKENNFFNYEFKDFYGIYNDNDETFYLTDYFYTDKKYGHNAFYDEAARVKNLSDLRTTFNKSFITALSEYFKTIDVHQCKLSKKVDLYNLNRTAYRYYITNSSFDVINYLTGNYEESLKLENYFVEYIFKYIAKPDEAIALALQEYLTTAQESITEDYVRAVIIQKKIDYYNKIQKDALKRSILTAFTLYPEAKTFKLHFIKDNEPLECKIKNRISYENNRISNSAIVESQVQDYLHRHFGYNNEDIRWEEITQITYGKNVLYNKVI